MRKVWVRKDANLSYKSVICVCKLNFQITLQNGLHSNLLQISRCPHDLTFHTLLLVAVDMLNYSVAYN
jgi:hypothetical protein